MPKGSRVLMADDDKMLIDMYQERLELAGYIVTVCRNGEEALGKIREAKPDIVLLDIMMPKINGYEALASIKSDPATKDIPVIMLSALMRDFNREKAVEAGADDYLIKSEAMPADVITKIEQVLTKYGKGTVPIPGSNIPAPSATPPVVAPLPVVPAPAPMEASHVSTPVATPEASIMQPDVAKPEEPKPEEPKPVAAAPEKPIFEAAPVSTTQPEPIKTEEVPVVKLNQQPSTPPSAVPTMAWEAEPNKELKDPNAKKPASTTLIVILAILMTALINDFVIYFFFFANR